MSAISSRAPEDPGPRPAFFTPAQRIGLLIDVAVAAGVGGMPGLMIKFPDHGAGSFQLSLLAAAVAELERMAGRQLSAVDREREFFRDASHAIRTPVTIARGHLELATAGDLDEETLADVSVAMLQLDRMSSLSNRLLAMARLDA